MHPEFAHLQKLPLAEKLQLVEELWDDIGQSNEHWPLPDWHHTEAERRVAELNADPSLALTREGLWRRVDSINETE